MPGMPLKATVEMVGLDDLLWKLGQEKVLGPWKAILDTFGRQAEGKVRERIPVGTGDARSTIHHKLQAKEIPTWVSVGWSAKVLNGFRVMGALEGGRRYHYSSGSHRGSQTKGYWTGLKNLFESQTSDMAERAGQEVEAGWQS